MTIYFDKNKQAYGFVISNPIATIDDETWLKYAGTDKWNIIDGSFNDITNTEEYKSKLALQETEAKKTELQAQIDEIDKRRIRAIAEPEVKNSTTGQTWLEYYNLQISDLRKEISGL